MGNVYEPKNGNGWFIEVADGTSKLKFPQRAHLDLIIQNLSDLHDMGLAKATRFGLNKADIVTLPWTPEFFGCWSDMDSPYMVRSPSTNLEQ